MVTLLSPDHPSADVQFWCNLGVYVRCPYCTRIHRHEFDKDNPNHWTDTIVPPGCDSSYPSYRLKYPFSEQDGIIEYEVHEIRGFFVANGVDLAAMLKEFDGTVPTRGFWADRNADPRPSWTAAKEMISISSSDVLLAHHRSRLGGDYRLRVLKLDHVVGQMLTASDSEDLADYLAMGSEKELFLKGVDDKGNSALNLATCTAFENTVEVLLKAGADPNNQNYNGRSPLMSAALWGRVKAVQALLRYGADTTLRDENDRQAIDFAALSILNDEERDGYLGTQAGEHFENPLAANRARNVIAAILRQSTVPQKKKKVAAPPQVAGPDSHYYVNSSEQRGGVAGSAGKYTDEFQLCAPVATYVIRRRKALATLYRPGRHRPVSAKSGYGHGIEPPGIISGIYWTDVVLRLAKRVRHTLEIDAEWDQGVAGQFMASHAEKQLMAYFVLKHGHWIPEDSPLCGAEPPLLLRKSIHILVNKPICKDCKEFIEAVNREFALDIIVEYRESVVSPKIPLETLDISSTLEADPS